MFAKPFVITDKSEEKSVKIALDKIGDSELHFTSPFKIVVPSPIIFFIVVKPFIVIFPTIELVPETDIPPKIETLLEKMELFVTIILPETDKFFSI